MALKPIKKEAKTKAVRAPHKRVVKKAAERMTLIPVAAPEIEAERLVFHEDTALRAAEVEATLYADEAVPFEADGDIQSIFLPVPPWYSRFWNWLNS